MESLTSSRSSRGDDDLSRSPARIFCLVVGATLVLVGLLGFLAESKFDTSSGGDGGALDGKDVLGLFPVNPADNILHIVLTVAALAAGLAPLRDRTRVSAARTT